jgi:hypothetical protein
MVETVKALRRIHLSYPWCGEYVYALSEEGEPIALLLAGTQLEVVDVCAPNGIATGSEVLVGVPDGAIIHRVHAGCRIVTPPGAAVLKAGTGYDVCFGREDS